MIVIYVSSVHGWTLQVFLVGLVSDVKYSHFKPVLDVYIDETFSATLAYK